jgi:adenylyl cyclase-associated protein
MEIVSDFNPTGPAKTVIDQNNPLKLLVNRLEAATSRLEDIAASTHGIDEPAPANAPSSVKALSTTDLPVISEAPSLPTPRASVAPLPPFLADLDELHEKELKAFVAASTALDPLLAEPSAVVAKGFADQRKFLLIATKAKRPTGQAEFTAITKDLQQDMQDAGHLKNKNRKTPLEDHTAMIEGGMSVLVWLTIDGKPADWVKGAIESAQTDRNRVLKQSKDG